MGEDVCLVLTGGDRPHCGAVAVAQVRESLSTRGKLSSTVSNITLLGHKEDVLARRLASRVAVAVAANAVVCCGIHLDDISADEITAILDAADDMTNEAIEGLKP